MTRYDVIVIGGGPGGYVAALRAAREGKKTALVEKSFLGGTCLNRGCIPSKTLLRHAKIIEDIKKGEKWGIETSSVQFNWHKMFTHKEEVIQTLKKGITSLIHSEEIEVYEGKGKILNNRKVSVESAENKREIDGKNIIIATGSSPFIPPIEGLQSVNYHTTDSIFDIEAIPSSLVIVGGGVIGLELADAFSSLDVNVTIVEMRDRLIPTEDEEASKLIKKQLKKKGINILLNYELTKVSEEESDDKGKKIVLKERANEDEYILSTEEILVAVGRVPNLEVIENFELKREQSFIKVNDFLETSEQGIFAIGDVIGNYQLAHVASSEALTAVTNLEGQNKKQSYKVIPRCVYTSPQMASVGYTEMELSNKAIGYETHTYYFSSNGMALATGEADGISKVMVDRKYGEILGVVMVGANVTEIISQSSAYMFLEGTLDELAEMIQPHPSLSEALMESANAILKRNIHS